MVHFCSHWPWPLVFLSEMTTIFYVRCNLRLLNSPQLWLPCFLNVVVTVPSVSFINVTRIGPNICVAGLLFQRKDYTALTKFLPPKHEYVISIRLSLVQVELYEKYLGRLSSNVGDLTGMTLKGSRIFTDYQNLMKIWTHPWVLKMDEIRQETKVFLIHCSVLLLSMCLVQDTRFIIWDSKFLLWNCHLCVTCTCHNYWNLAVSLFVICLMPYFCTIFLDLEYKHHALFITKCLEIMQDAVLLWTILCT